MVGYRSNDTVSDHIWDSLMNNNRESLVDQAHNENVHNPRLHPDWMTMEERTRR